MSPSITSRQAGGPDYLLVPSQRLQVVRSTKGSHFTGELAKNASESESLTGLLSNRAIITKVSIQAVQPLKYRVHLFATSGFTNSDLDKDTYLGAVELDLKYGLYALYVNSSKSLDKFEDYIGALPSPTSGYIGQIGGTVYWAYQTFRHTSDYTLEQVKLRLFRTADTSTDMTVSIRKAVVSAPNDEQPTGSDLSSWTGNIGLISNVFWVGELVTFPMSPPVAIFARQPYAIVARLKVGSVEDWLRWCVAAGNPYSGNAGTSITSGASWNGLTDRDNYFEVHGRAGAPHYSLALPVSIPYEDRDDTKKLHVVLENLSPTAKDAGASGEVVVEVAYTPAS